MLANRNLSPITEIYAPVAWVDPKANEHLPREVRAIMTGPAGAPLIVALGGISADAEVVSDARGHQGWWKLFSPKDRHLSRYRVLGIDFAADDSGSFAPSPQCQSQIIDAALNAFGEIAPYAIIGASYGGMVALAWAERANQPDTFLTVISADDRPHPAATAFRSIQRRLVDLGIRNNCSGEALALARSLAMIGYRSPQEFRHRFNGGIADSNPLAPSEPGDYIAARGEAFLNRMSPGRFLSLSASIDRQRVDVSAIANPALLISVEEDQIVPPIQMQAMAKHWGGCRSLKSIHSIFGHDAFLKEVGTLGPLVSTFLNGEV